MTTPIGRIAQQLEDAAIEAEAASNKLRSLGRTAQAQATRRLARSLAVMSRDLTGRSSEGLLAFFGIGSVTFMEETVSESVVPVVPGARRVSSALEDE